MNEIRRDNFLLLCERFETDRDFSQAAGIATGYTSQLKMGGKPIGNGRNIGEKLARKIEARLGIDNGWLDNDNTNPVNNVMESSPNYHKVDYRPVILWDKLDDLPDGEYVLVGAIDVRAAAGDGFENGDYPEEKHPLAYRADWIKGSKAKSTNLKVIRAEGDSMHPTIFDGDEILLDLGQSQVQNGYVYAFIAEGRVSIKRLHMKGDTVVASSDNNQDPKYKYDREYTHDIRIIGRVVHRGGSSNL